MKRSRKTFWIIPVLVLAAGTYTVYFGKNELEAPLQGTFSLKKAETFPVSDAYVK